MQTRSRAVLAALLALGGALSGTFVAIGAPPAVAQETGLPEDPTEPHPVAPPVQRTPEEEARRARVVAHVGEATITIGHIEDELAGMSPFMRARYRDRAQLEELVHTLVRFELLAREAERNGIGSDPEVREVSAQSAVQQLIRHDFDERITVDSIADEDSRAFYDAHPEEFSRPEVRRVSHIVVETQEQADALVAEARSADARGFRQLAQERSVDPDSRQRGGDLRYFDDHGVSPNSAEPAVAEPIVQAAFALTNIGDVADPVQVAPNRFSIVKLTGLRPAEHRSFEDARDGIRLRLWRQRRQSELESFVDTLRTRIPTELHPERMQNLRFEAPDRLSADPHGPNAERGSEGEAEGAGEQAGEAEGQPTDDEP